MFGKRCWFLLPGSPSIRPGWVLDQLRHSAWGVDRNPSWLLAASVKMKFMTFFPPLLHTHVMLVVLLSDLCSVWSCYPVQPENGLIFLVGVAVQRGKVGMCSHIPHMHWESASYSLMLYLEQRVPTRSNLRLSLLAWVSSHSFSMVNLAPESRDNFSFLTGG